MEDTQPEAAVGDSVSDQRDESSNTEPSAFAPGSSVQQSSTHHTTQGGASQPHPDLSAAESGRDFRPPPEPAAMGVATGTEDASASASAVSELRMTATSVAGGVQRGYESKQRKKEAGRTVFRTLRRM